jgi:hypothetical protein
VVEALTVDRAGELVAGLLPAPGPVRAVSRFAEGSVTGAYRIEFAGADPAPVVLKIYEAGGLRSAVKEVRALRVPDRARPGHLAARTGLQQVRQRARRPSVPGFLAAPGADASSARR